MPTQTDTPSGIGSYDEWGIYGPGAVNKIQAVAESDNDNSVIWAFSHGREFTQTYTFPVIAGVTDPVTSASINVVAREYQAGNAQRFWAFHWGGVRQTGTIDGEAMHLNSPGYGAYGHAATGGDLALAKVNGEHGFYMKAASGTGWEVWVSHVYRVVTYSYPVMAATSGDVQFAHLVGSIAALIGGNLLLREMPAVSAALGRVRLLPEEYERAWKAWRAYKHPTWSV